MQDQGSVTPLEYLRAVVDARELGPLEKLVALALLRFADGAGNCYPGAASLVRATGLDERTIRRVRQKLREKGFVNWSPGGKDRHGSFQANVYLLVLPRGDGEAEAETAGTPPGGSAPPPGGPQTPPGGSAPPPGGHTPPPWGPTAPTPGGRTPPPWGPYAPTPGGPRPPTTTHYVTDHVTTHSTAHPTAHGTGENHPTSFVGGAPVLPQDTFSPPPPALASGGFEKVSLSPPAGGDAARADAPGEQGTPEPEGAGVLPKETAKGRLKGQKASKAQKPDGDAEGERSPAGRRGRVAIPSEALDLARHLAGLIRRVNPRAVVRDAHVEGEWAHAIRLLHQEDGQAWEDIRRVIDWTMTDDFWCRQIQSGQALRKHWNRLAAKAFPTRPAVPKPRRGPILRLGGR
jgi:hypothetical protein